jgi:hypothetical protein
MVAAGRDAPGAGPGSDAVRRTGLGRHGGLADDSGDPLDGLVNLFDLGIVLAVGFLVAALGLTIDQATNRIEREPNSQVKPIPQPGRSPQVSGQGQAVGTVYRLPDGRLIYTQDGRSP